MPVSARLASILDRTRTLPVAARYLVTVLIVLGIFAAQQLLDPGIAPSSPFGHYLVAVLICGTLFDHGSGIVATTLSALLAVWANLPPVGRFALEGPREWVALGLFLLVAGAITTVVESLHRTITRLQTARDDLLRSERARDLVMREFRHRTRNDLGSLVSLLLLRARSAPSDVAREALREAADHALALSRVHARLSLDEGLGAGAERPMVDTREFVAGLSQDIESALFGQGLRAVHLTSRAEAHPLSAERAVPLGLVLNETVTNALKYAFPEERPGTVEIRFAREGEDYVLAVTDDGIGLPPEGEVEDAPPAQPAGGAGLGTRLLRALASQLRGRFARRRGPDGRGTVAELRFPAAEPGG